jgi:hypothetical protein
MKPNYKLACKLDTGKRVGKRANEFVNSLISGRFDLIEKLTDFVG